MDIKTIFQGVTRDWMKILTGPEMSPKLADTLAQIQYADVVPSWGDVFTFAKYPLKNARVVILGMDPYSDPNFPHGLAFSSRDPKRCPQSLQRIFRVLIQSGLLADMPKTYRLDRWAEQGVVLLNTAFTTESGTSGAHLKVWAPYTDAVISQLSERGGLTWLLWGNDAQSKIPLINTSKNTVKIWCHPAERTGKFIECPHFADLRDIDWNPDSDGKLYNWFTDGSCKGNGRWGARAGWGAHCGELKWEAADRVEAKTVGGKDLKPTNIRSEGMAILAVLKKIKGDRIYGSHVIYTDSLFWIDMIQTHIPKWISQKQFQWSQKANPDLCEEMWTTWGWVTGFANIRVKFHFVNAWHDYQPTDDTTRFAWEGNCKAERLAESVLKCD